MPLNSSPPTLDAPSFAAKLAACSKAARTDFALWGGLTPDNLDQLEALADCGVAGYKAFMSGSGIEDFRRCDDEDLYRGMRSPPAGGLPVAVHAEERGAWSALAPRRRRAAGRPRRATTWLASGGCRGRGHLPRHRHRRPDGLQAPRRAHELRTRRAADPRGRGSARPTSAAKPARTISSSRTPTSSGSAPRAKCAPPLRPAPNAIGLLALVARGPGGHDRLGPFPGAALDEGIGELLRRLGRDQRRPVHAARPRSPCR